MVDDNCLGRAVKIVDTDQRTQSGLARAKSEGKVLGRPHALDMTKRQEAFKRLSDGETVASIARGLNTSRATVMRLRQHLQHQ